jgi:hypothetical protein
MPGSSSLSLLASGSFGQQGPGVNIARAFRSNGIYHHTLLETYGEICACTGFVFGTLR